MTKKVQVDLDKQQKMSAAMLKDINNVVDQVKESNYQEKVENRVNEAGETFAKTMNQIQKEGGDVINEADKFRNDLDKKVMKAQRAVNETYTQGAQIFNSISSSIPDSRDISRAIGNL